MKIKSGDLVQVTASNQILDEHGIFNIHKGDVLKVCSVCNPASIIFVIHKNKNKPIPGILVKKIER